MNGQSDYIKNISRELYMIRKNLEQANQNMKEANQSLKEFLDSVEEAKHGGKRDGESMH